jgi:hypothetical protein
MYTAANDDAITYLIWKLRSNYMAIS